MAAQSSSWMLMLLALACLLFAHDKMILVQVHASDSDPLQDFCVADLSATAPSVNGFPCKLRSNVTAKKLPIHWPSNQRTGWLWYVWINYKLTWWTCVFYVFHFKLFLTLIPSMK
jgi:hypothetical protein